jgi:thiol-disulfide isomerase/thioredoxin
VKITPAALALLLLTACQQRSPPDSTDGGTVAAKSPAPGDPDYVAEDPRLARLVGQPGPAISLQMVDGRKIDLKKLYGSKPVYLKLWATYCIPCRAQMPGFEKIYESVGDRMEVIAVNAGVGDDAAKVTAFAQKAGMHMPLAIDDGALGAWIRLQETPLHIIIGRDGRVLYAGHQDGPQLDAAIRNAIAAKAGGPVATAEVASIAVLRPGDIVPAITLRDSRDRPVELKRGATARPRAILFTSVWCESYLKDTEPQSVPKCRHAREEVDRLSKSGRVEWLGIASHLWTDRKSLASYEEHAKPRIAMAVDTDGTAFRTFGIRRFPAIALIDRQGRLTSVIGPDEADIGASVATLARPE